MQDLPNSEQSDIINLRELFVIFWAHKLFITVSCALGIMYGGYYALNANKQYSSTAIFTLDNKASTGVSPLKQLGSLVNLSEFGAGIKPSALPIDQVKGRIFIQNLEPTLNFQADPYFNTYKANAVDPIWKSLIKRAIGWQKPSIDAQEAIWQGIVATYSNNVTLSKTKNGSVKIVVTHTHPERAAEIANVIMNKIISTQKNRSDLAQDQQLLYLSSTLAKALSDLEVSQSNLKEFALENSALPLESFAAGSLRLDALREQFIRTSELHEAVAALSLMLQNEKTNQVDYLALRQKFPIVDQVEFRRVLGQNEIISSWSWPDPSSVSAVFDTLSERKIRLQSQINASQINAERSGLALETYAKLEREAKVAEATYTVLIEQVKAQSMAAGFRPNKTEIYEYATASRSPTSPNRILILTLGAVLGLFVGAVLSIIMANLRSVYYSNNSLKIGAQARLTASIKSLLPLRNKTLNDINIMLNKKPRPILRDIAVEIHKSSATHVVVTSSRAKMTGNDMARTLASYMQSESVKVAMIDFSSKAKALSVDSKRLSVGSFVITESAGHISVLRPDGELATMELLSHRNFLEKIQLLNSTFDLVFLSADNGDAISLLSALEGQKAFHITLARTKNTKSDALAQMRSLIPIQGLLHD